MPEFCVCLFVLCITLGATTFGTVTARGDKGFMEGLKSLKTDKIVVSRAPGPVQ